MSLWLRVAAICTMFGASGCAINTTVKPVASDKLADVCIQRNDQVLMSAFLPELDAQLRGRGVKTRIVAAPAPSDCPQRLEYTANWAWDLAMYVTYMDIKIYDRTSLLGQATYDARHGGGRLDKFGPTGEKLKVLLDQLLKPGT